MDMNHVAANSDGRTLPFLEDARLIGRILWAIRRRKARITILRTVDLVNEVFGQ